MDFDTESTCLQKSLGLTWDVITDVFIFRLSLDEKPYTKRGLLSVINGIFDPLGFAAPVILGGRLILRQAIQNHSLDWDDPLPSELLSDWQEWKTSLKELENLDIYRPYTNLPFNGAQCELHVFADASKDAIAAVAYIRMFQSNSSRIGFVMGKSKLAPNHGHTIPRLELCAALLATELATFIQRQLKLPPSQTHFYTDSQVVLGYLYNETRRFYVYVSNRVDRILKASLKSQWHYISTDLNPADCGTRPLNSNRLSYSTWLQGPTYTFTDSLEGAQNSLVIVEPEKDKEVIPLVQVRKIVVSSSLGSTRFERFSSWNRLVNAISFLKQ